MKHVSPYLRLGLSIVSTALAVTIWVPAQAKRPVEGLGLPPGIELVATLPPPAWDGVAFKGGVVSVSHPLAAQAGADILERGGNAIDAAAAIQFMLNVVEPQFSGIGGGGFMMIHLGNRKQTFAIDGREKAPAAATPTQFVFTGVPATQRFTIASTSGLSVGVPGTLAAVDAALRGWGTIKLADALAPAIEVAEQGFAINRFLAANIAADGGRTSLQPETAAVFRPNGVPLQEGQILVQPDLAKTFRLIARHGPSVFYQGEIGQAIVAAQQRSRTPVTAEGAGRMTARDLANYSIAIRAPVQTDYRGWTVAAMSPPSSGGLTVGQMLELVERFPIGNAAQGYGFGNASTLHVMIEAMRLAFADRAVWMGDEDFVPVPKVGLLHPDYVASRSVLINPGSRMATPAAGNPLPFDSAITGKQGDTPAGRRGARDQAFAHHPLLGGRQVGQRRELHDNDRGRMGLRHHGAWLRLPAEQRADRLQP